MNRRPNPDSIRRAVFAAGLLVAWCVPVEAADQPNIVLILADDLGYEIPGSYGGESYPTPNLDALAAGGARFTHAYSTPKCTPSRVKMLTGRYGFRTGQAWGYIPPDEITFGHVLKEAGYRTALAGKWQLGLMGENPRRVAEAGFEESSVWGWHEGPRYWRPFVWQNSERRIDVADRYGPDVFVEFLIDFMEREKEGPFLAFYSMVLPHIAKTKGRYAEPKGPNDRYQTFAEMVARLDENVGRIVEALERLGIRENTLILFAGDNGTDPQVTSRFKGRDYRGGKDELTDAGTRVPLIANWPGRVEAGAVYRDLIDFSDFLPTLAELGGARPPADRSIDGASFANRLLGKEGAARSWAYTEFQGRAWIRNQRWKLYRTGEIYDVSADAAEQQPLGIQSLEADEADEVNALKRALEGLHGSASN